MGVKRIQPPSPPKWLPRAVYALVLGGLQTCQGLYNQRTAAVLPSQRDRKVSSTPRHNVPTHLPNRVNAACCVIPRRSRSTTAAAESSTRNYDGHSLGTFGGLRDTRIPRKCPSRLARPG